MTEREFIERSTLRAKQAAKSAIEWLTAAKGAKISTQGREGYERGFEAGYKQALYDLKAERKITVN